MSDILIRGMKMPKEFDPDVYIELACGIDGNRYARLYNFHRGGLTEWCEIVPVPPHGDLISRDALADVFRGFIAMYDSCPFSQLSLTDKARRDELQSALAEVINAPTVIPAEEKHTIEEFMYGQEGNSNDGSM